MSAIVERLIYLIQSEDSILQAENIELSSLLARLEPQQIPAANSKEVASVIDMMFLTNNVLAENVAHLNRIHQHLTRSATLC